MQTKSIIFFLLVTISIYALTDNKIPNKKKAMNKKSAVTKLKPIKECKELLTGKFLDYNLKKSEPPSTITRSEGYSLGISEKQKWKSKIEMIENCKFEFTMLEYENSNYAKEIIQKILNFKPIEEVYKIENNKAYYKGVNCECEGYYEKIE